jgi:predicted DCC family thiol-disulfide oxidoreductase YuxK
VEYTFAIVTFRAGRALRQWLTRTYLTFDGRSLAFGRIVLGIVLLVDVVRRIRWIRDFYSNEGLIPNHTVLWQPPQPRAFSLFLLASHPDESAFLFAIAFVCFFCLLIGYKTRLFHVLSFIMTTSLHCRILFAENGGAVALGAVVFWTAFMPLGRRFSVDAVLQSLREHARETPADLASARAAPDARPFVSLAVFALLLQLAVIYTFNYAHKTGHTWHDGTAVYYVLWQERIITTIGLWGRHHFPFALTKWLTYGTLVIEAAAPILILSPVLRPVCRTLAIVLLTGLHGSIAILVNLGIFSAAMLSYYPFLIDTEVWDALKKLERPRRRTVFYDAGCGVCFQIVRVLARLDARYALRFVPNDDADARPASVDPALLESSVVVLDPRTGHISTRAEAVADVFASLPGGFLFAWPLRVPGLRSLANAAYDAFARRRAAISVGLGYAACSVRGSGSTGDGGARASGIAPSPWRAWVRRQTALWRELGVALSLLIAFADFTVSNSAWPVGLRWTSRPDWMTAAVMYSHVQEGWGMFAPEAPIYDEMVVVDAVTRDGRHVDPYNEVGSRVHALPVQDIPERLGHDSFFCDYTLRIPGSGSYHQALIEWIQRYPERTHNPQDAIVSFEAYKIEHTPPPPGQTKPTNVRHTTFLRWPTPTH